MNRRISVNTGSVVPQSFITKGKQRLKQHTNNVYLKNSDEFEIELFNPTSNKVLAKIELNGKSIGSGIILRPGQRVFLERYLDEAKKFLFETYQVDGKNDEVKKAIVDNGVVSINFYDETIDYKPFIINTWGTSTPTLVNNPFKYGSSTTNTFTNLNPTFTTTGLSEFSSSVTMDSFNSSEESIGRFKKSKAIETGRVEKGSYSDQTFTYDSTKFNSFAFKSDVWKILPLSQKNLMKEDLVTYCTECGSKRKKDSFKFCPNCGTKY